MTKQRRIPTYPSNLKSEGEARSQTAYQGPLKFGAGVAEAEMEGVEERVPEGEGTGVANEGVAKSAKSVG